MSKILEGRIYEFGLKKKRRFLCLVLPIQQILKLFSLDHFNGLTGKGEQRPLVDAHAKMLSKEFLNDNFTPSSLTAGLRKSQLDKLVITKKEGHPWAKLTLDDDEYLPMTDGGHRTTVCKQLAEMGNEAAFLLPFIVCVNLDGSLKEDFVNLQRGKAVAPTHILAMRVLSDNLPEKDATFLKAAYETAKLLHTDPKSVFEKMIKFDMCGLPGLPLATICPKSASELATSLVGTARIALKAGTTPLNPEWMASTINRAIASLRKLAPELLAPGQLLCPPPEGGKGSATMLVGVANMLAFKTLSSGSTKHSEESLVQLATAAQENLAGGIRGNLSSPCKRNLIWQFAKAYFAEDYDQRLHDGIPVALLNILAPSHFASPSRLASRCRRSPGKIGGKQVLRGPRDWVLARQRIALS